MTSNEYAVKLRDPRWQKRRLEIFNLHNFTCQDCDSKDKTLHAHHCWYIHGREPWDYPDHCFRCLCEECHDARHPIENRAVLLFRQIIARNKPELLARMEKFLMTCVANGSGVSMIETVPHNALEVTPATTTNPNDLVDLKRKPIRPKKP